MSKVPANIRCNRNIWRIGLIIVLAGVTASFPMVVASQGEVEVFTITEVNTDAFPLVRLQVAARDRSGASLDLLSDTSMQVLEDGVELPIASVEPVEAGIRLAFVIDPGDGVLHTGVSLASVYDTAREHIQTFILGRPWMVAGVDEVTILVQEGPSTVILAPMTDDPQEIGDKLTEYIPPPDYGFLRPPDYGDFTRAALEHGLDELLYSAGGEFMPQALVIFTPGVRADLADVAERAINVGIPIHVILTRTQETHYWGEALRPLAEVTGGKFIALYEAEGLEQLFEFMTAPRGEYIVSFRSTSSSPSMREVFLELNRAGQSFQASSQYSVELETPQVEIVSPNTGSQITRQGQKDIETPAEAAPTFIIVEAVVSWGDEYPREIRQSRLLVDDITIAQSQMVDERVEFTWDIRSYQAEGQVPAELQVQVEDELGMQGISSSVTIGIEYMPPPATGFTPSESMLVYVALGIALVAVALAVFLFFNRSRLVPAIQHAGENIIDFVERVTGRRTALIARAYLVPLEGFDKLPSKPYEIFGTTAIGRSRRHADLLFHINDEDSAISRLHCTILDEDDHFAIRDEDSTNGTLVNDEKLSPLEPLMLQDGDLIDVAPLERGGLRFLFQLARPDGQPPGMDDDIRRTRPRRILE
ncbi:MAG: FHA domain-containing protein [Anaerolineales bacterium]|nr:FHA domain-containing protein [Anaerolineales bacterium]